MAASCSYRDKLIQELLQGRQFANQLQLLLHHEHKPFQQQQQQKGLVSSHQQELVVKILRSFTETLSVLRSGTTAELVVSDYHDHHQLQLLPPTNSSNDSPCTDDRRLEDSGESKKRPASGKERRGCYKRKKHLETWRMVASTLEDAHAWRKYGQKEILNAKYPRSYYRCTHKYDQGCRATKQVQRMEDNPEMYETTYIGNHTCKDLYTAPKIITDSDHPWGTTGSYMVSPLNSSYTPTKIKQEFKEETTKSDDVSENLSSLDSVVWDDLIPFESSDPAAAISTVYSCSKMPSNSFDIDFDREFHFDESEFLLS